MFRGTFKGSNLRLEEESLNLRLEEELRSFVEPGPVLLCNNTSRFDHVGLIQLNSES